MTPEPLEHRRFASGALQAAECHPRLRSLLGPLARRNQLLRLSLALTACWALIGLAGLGFMALENALSLASWLELPGLGLLSVVLSVFVTLRFARQQPDWRALARKIEAQHPDLDGRLLTAVQQPVRSEESGYLQRRVLDEAVAHHERTDWGAMLPRSRLIMAFVAQTCALLFAVVVLWALRVPGNHHQLLTSRSGQGLTVTPGDVELERGSSLVVLAEFKGRPPAKVELVIGQGVESAPRVTLSRSLADPLFGGTIPEVASNFVYHLEFAGKRTRDFKVEVFEYPRLERADAEVTFPDYTGQHTKRIENTRRLSAVEGSRIDFTLLLNKQVRLARFVPKDTAQASVSLAPETNAPVATLRAFLLEQSRKYELQLVDLEGRTNKVPTQFVLEALKNRPPELKVAMPRGDTRPSALEEMTFEGTVWDDFGVLAYGLAYGVPGKEVKMLELGQNVPAKEKHDFHHLLKLEDLGVQPDDLVSWFVWADDIGPDGKRRRTTGDLFFAEVRPFEEVFRQGQSMSGGQEQQQGQAGGQEGAAARLGALQKQVINATWNLFRQTGATLQPGRAPGSETNGLDRSPSPPASLQRSSGLYPVAPPLAGRPRPVNNSIQKLSFFGVQIAAQMDPFAPSRSARGAGRPPAAARTNSASLPEDLGVVTDAQSQAIDQAQEAQQKQQDPRSAALWDAAIQQMQRALERLHEATNSSAAFQEALAAEQAAYQALLKLQEREYSVTRGRNRQSSQGARQQQLQRQLDQLDLTREENRYETERQAQAPQRPERREQLQVMNRLQELARRQQDVNDRLKELQTALQEARTEKEREEIRRRLKRLQEEEQQLLADADEVRQRMDRPENQARMSDQRRQLEQAREDLRRAAEATQQGEASQALAAGTRAQRQLQQMREDLRRQSASEFEDDLKRMRAEARELARQQEEVQKDLASLNDRGRKTLSDSDQQRQVLEQLAQQAQRLTNLVQRATQLSQQAEAAEPLMSRELYDALRKFSQNDSTTLKQFQEELMRELMTRGMTSRELYQRVKRIGEQSESKALDLTSEMVRQGFLPDAGLTEQQARAGINDLKRGVERAAESVLGDDAESLRLAAQELDRLADQLRNEITKAEGGQTNQTRAEVPRTGGERAGAQAGATNTPAQMAAGQNPGHTQANEENQKSGQTPTAQRGEQPQPGDLNQQPGNQTASQSRQESQAQEGEGESGTPRSTQTAQNSQRGSGSRRDTSGQRSPGPNSVRLAQEFDRLFDGRGGGASGGPITGEDFAPWSDDLRNIEELVETPSLRTDIARARERARQMRQDYKRNQQKPDWAVVRLQVLKPLVEVRDAIAEELARREPRDKSLVPIDRDPVPDRYSELVRRYYEELGKANDLQQSPATDPKPDSVGLPGPAER